jgi:solute carrier family 8 (sodium/calcium exchanger)
LKIKR